MQSMQDDWLFAPFFVLYVPAPQALQCDGFDAPTSSPYVPLIHLVQVFDAAPVFLE